MPVKEFSGRTFIAVAPYTTKEYLITGGLTEVCKVIQNWKKMLNYPPEIWEVNSPKSKSKMKKITKKELKDYVKSKHAYGVTAPMKEAVLNW